MTSRHLPVVQAFERYDAALTDAVARVREMGHTVPCREGCSACCADIAYVDEAELGPLVDRVRRWHPSKQLRLRDGIETWAKRLRGAGIDPERGPAEEGQPSYDLRSQYYSAHAMCPLLDRERHRCMVYEERPIACRGHYIIDEPASKCAHIDADPVTQNVYALEPTIDVSFAIYLSRKPDYGFLPAVLGRMLDKE